MAVCIMGFKAWAEAGALQDSDLAAITFEQRLNTDISRDLLFRDEHGSALRIGDCLNQKPTILVLGYYECPMLCTLELNGMVEALQDIKWSIGKDFEVINVSIDPRERASLAAAKKRIYLKRYGRAGAAEGWHFLTGDQPAIQRLADEVGFHYRYDARSGQFAHPSGLVILTPEGRISGYLLGLSYPSRDLFSALERASAHKVSSPVRKLVLLCFHYNPITGKYGVVIINSVRLLGVLTLVALFWLLLRGTRHKKWPEQPAPSPHQTS